MYVIDNQGEKFQKKLADLGLTATEAAAMIKISRDTIHKWFKKDRFDYKQIKKITQGLGLTENEIFGTPEDILNKVYEVNIPNSWITPNPKQEVTPIPYEDYMMVEYVDLSASAGPLGGSNVDILPDKKKRLVPKEFDNGNYLVVRVDGDSMVDGSMSSIPDGTEILVKEHILENGDKLPIRGNLFVICSSEGNVFKQIVEHNTEIGYIRCHSYNPNYPDYNIPLNEVHQIFVYKKIVSYRPSIPEIK